MSILERGEGQKAWPVLKSPPIIVGSIGKLELCCVHQGVIFYGILLELSDFAVGAGAVYIPCAFHRGNKFIIKDLEKMFFNDIFGRSNII